MGKRQVWVVRAGVNNEIASEVEKASVVAIGWGEMGDLAQLNGRDDFESRHRSKYADDSEVKVGMGAGQVYRFVREIQSGDIVLTPLAVSREVLIREVVGEYVYDSQAISKSYPNIRKVKFRKKVSRDELSVQFRNALGGLMTVFRVTSFLPEVIAILGEEPLEEVPEVEEQLPFTPEEIQAITEPKLIIKDPPKTILAD